MKKITYVKGITIYGHKSFIRFLFGQDAVISATRTEDMTFRFILDVVKNEQTTSIAESYEKEFFGVSIKFM